MTVEIILAIIAGVSSIVAAYLGYRQHVDKQHREQETSIVSELGDRVEELETRVDTLGDKLIQNAEKAELQRRELTAFHDKQISDLRKEMRRLLDDATLEATTWRDRYHKVNEEYQRIRVELAGKTAELSQLQRDYDRLRALYEQRLRTSPDIGNTP